MYLIRERNVISFLNKNKINFWQNKREHPNLEKIKKEKLFAATEPPFVVSNSVLYLVPERIRGLLCSM